MRLIITLVTLFFFFQGFTQVVPNVSADSLSLRLFPIYSEAYKTGLYNSPLDTTWQHLQKHETDAVSFQIPDKWLNLGGLSSVVEVAFDASGLYLPEKHNDRPVLVGAFLLNQRGRSLEEAKDSALKDYRSNADRVFETGYLDTTYKYNLVDGGKAYVLHTRFYRKSTELNQSRYDLILYSDMFKKGYSLMLSIQYGDPTYSFEKDYSLQTLAARLFSTVSLK